MNWSRFFFERSPRCAASAATRLLALLFAIAAAAATARAQHAGSIDPSFTSPISAAAYRTDSVSGIVVQPDGKLLLNGSFAQSQPANGDSPLIRVNADGSLDSTFHTRIEQEFVSAFLTYVLLQPDGKIIVVGSFASIDGVARANVARLNSDGTLDPSFQQPDLGPISDIYSPPSAAALQPDGKLLAGGTVITGYEGGNGYPVIANYEVQLVRLNADGSRDATFQIANKGYAPVSVNLGALLVQADGKIVLGGTHAVYYNANIGAPPSPPTRFENSLARLNADGSLDTSFAPGFLADTPILGLTVQPGTGGKLLVLTNSPDDATETKATLRRLNADGTDDETFYCDHGPGISPSFVVQPDGRIAARVYFDSSLSYPSTSLLARFGVNGGTDLGFDIGAGPHRDTTNAKPAFYSLALQPDGKLLVAGIFSDFDVPEGTPASGHPDLVRLFGAPSLPAFFSGQEAIGFDFHQLDAGEAVFFNGAPSSVYFGRYYLGLYPIVFHDDLGALCAVDARDGNAGIYFYDFGGLGWLYTSRALFPYLYSFDRAAFLYYFRASDGSHFSSYPRVFADLKTGEILYR